MSEEVLNVYGNTIFPGGRIAFAFFFKRQKKDKNGFKKSMEVF
ncbi:hypothetical protein HM1_2855 [Heliomicrobium modesticaldum Ice1]|uniref:Uncharacterized protein n=1 Tax=Heliobacterium modesticaldum (strain ATCC 51547 / Ice1) TaxID=498761 RepID=B0TCH6_HELMI|nr:hypothetical protein HM1_2855 [Heliomicrobium modesticaldum Ice1]